MICCVELLVVNNGVCNLAWRAAAIICSHLYGYRNAVVAVPGSYMAWERLYVELKFVSMYAWKVQVLRGHKAVHVIVGITGDFSWLWILCIGSVSDFPPFTIATKAR